MFSPGQRVLCVNNKCPGFWKDRPEQGAVYTVLEMGQFFPEHIIGKYITVRLKEISNCCFDDGFDYGYNPRRFRPIDDERLEIFREMLKPVLENA